MPEKNTDKSINQRLGKVIKQLPKLKGEEGVFDNMAEIVTALEEEVAHRIEKAEIRAIHRDRKAEADTAAEEQAEVEANRVEQAVAARQAVIETEQAVNEAEAALAEDPENEDLMAKVNAANEAHNAALEAADALEDDS